MTNETYSPPKLPKRSRRYGVGKEIGGAIYVHKRYEHLLGSPVATAQSRLPGDFQYTVVKLSLRRGKVTFLYSPDFDEAHEPVVGASASVSPNGDVQLRSQARDPFLYHHKWLFVSDDYLGFDIEASKRRSIQWMSLSPPVDFRRIGRKSYWESAVLPRLVAPYLPPVVSTIPQ